jgi:1,4-dihydroxy-2-naphthoate octaprenyltransferase
MHDMVLLTGMVISIGFIWIGLKAWGVAGGAIGVALGIALTGIMATNADVDLGKDAGCSRYSSFADDC